MTIGTRERPREVGESSPFIQEASPPRGGGVGPPAPHVGDLLDRAWRAWDLGDADGVLALIAQARALSPLDLSAVAWMDEAEAVAREQADIVRYQRCRALLRDGDTAKGLRAWLDLSASARAAIRTDFQLPEFGWLDELDAGRLDAAVALGRALAALQRGDAEDAGTLLEPHRRLLEGLSDGRAAFDRVRTWAPPAPTGEAATAAPPIVARPSNAPAAHPASPLAIASLATHLAAGGTFKVEAPATDWALVLALALRDLLPGKDLDADLDGILRVIDGRDGWKVLPAEIAVRLIELIAARLRCHQVAGVVDRRVEIAFSCVSGWSKREKPGFAHGLSRDHRPMNGSWEADVDAAVDDLYGVLPTFEPTPKIGKRLGALEGLVVELATCPVEVRDAVRVQIRSDVSALLADGVSARNTRLVRILAPVAEDLTGPDMRALRRAARVAATEVEAGPDVEEADAPIPDGWAWWSATRGRRAVMVGGDPRELNRLKLEKAFGFGELAWEQAEHSRNSLQKVRDRVRSGGVDIVLILTRFVGHDADQVIQPACKEAGVPFVPVKSGYGVAGIRRAIEQYIPVAKVGRAGGASA